MKERMRDLVNVPGDDLTAAAEFVRKYAPLSEEEWITLWRLQLHPPADFQAVIERMASRAR